MASTTNDSLNDMQEARAYFRRHTAGMAEVGWDFQPFPHTNNIRQILMHMIATNRGVLAMLGGEAFEMKRHGERHKEAWAEVEGQSGAYLLALLDQSGEAIAASVQKSYAYATFDTPLTLWGTEGKLGVQLARLSQETAYHTGQVSSLRQAFDPSWDYFSEVFGA